MKTKRHFTRAQVEQEVMSTHTHDDPNEVIHIVEVSLLRCAGDDWSIPVWVVKFKRVYKEGTSFEQVYHATAILTEKVLYGKWYLWYLSESPLPENCTTPDEEEAAIRVAFFNRMQEACP